MEQLLKRAPFLSGRNLLQGIIPFTCAGLAKYMSFMYYLALVYNFLTADLTIHPESGPADDRLDRSMQSYFLDSKEFLVGHDLVSAELGEVTSFFAGGIHPGLVAEINVRAYSNGKVVFYIDKRCRNLAIILDS
jgi:hypothetical protein